MTAVNPNGGGIDVGGGIACVLENLPARYSNPVVVGTDIDQIRSVDVNGDWRASQCGGVISG
jgi:hypothetical protein